ncbi:hypothetical protein [Candidatus Tisiphia endosymbiont of Nemotelus uliginosus]|uniref:hypothetical protein n=1 Tax=Candidatus Tisiphia endosymbiont of Nemotelus uliginosus TaxID=3077926 RepID=UPI0035C8EE8D
MKIFSSSAGPIFLLATSALHPTVNSFPIESTTSILPSDAYSTSPKDHTLLSKLEGSYIANNSVETLNHFLKKLNDSLTLSQKLYEEDSFSNTLDDDSFKPFDNLPEWKKYNTKYPPLNTSAESTITAETDSTATPLEVTSSISEESTITAEINSTATPLEVTSTTSAESTITAEINSTATPLEVTSTTSAESTITAETDSTATPLEVTSTTSAESTITAETDSTATPLEVTSTTSAESTITAETNSTVSSTASSQEQNSNQGLWSYSIALGLTIIGAATMLIKNKFCSNETQEESNKEMDTFDLSDFLTPVNNVTLELDNVALMAEPTEDTQA